MRWLQVKLLGSMRLRISEEQNQVGIGAGVGVKNEPQ